MQTKVVASLRRMEKRMGAGHSLGRAPRSRQQAVH